MASVGESSDLEISISNRFWMLHSLLFVIGYCRLFAFNTLQLQLGLLTILWIIAFSMLFAYM